MNEWVQGARFTVCWSSPAKHIPCFSKIALLRNDWYTKRREGEPDTALLRSVSTDVLGTPSISTVLFHHVKHPELLSAFTQHRGTATHHLSHYADADAKTNLRFMGPACGRSGRLFRLIPHSHWHKKPPYIEFQSHETEENRTLTDCQTSGRRYSWQCGQRTLIMLVSICPDVKTWEKEWAVLFTRWEPVCVDQILEP